LRSINDGSPAHLKTHVQEAFADSFDITLQQISTVCARSQVHSSCSRIKCVRSGTRCVPNSLCTPILEGRRGWSVVNVPCFLSILLATLGNWTIDADPFAPSSSSTHMQQGSPGSPTHRASRLSNGRGRRLSFAITTRSELVFMWRREKRTERVPNYPNELLQEDHEDSHTIHLRRRSRRLVQTAVNDPSRTRLG
jgi:hypothetical protein